MIRILEGIVFLSKEMSKLENAVTNVRPKVINKAGSIFTVTANAEQIPRICTVTGLLPSSGSVSSALFFLEKALSLFTGASVVAVLILILFVFLYKIFVT